MKKLSSIVLFLFFFNSYSFSQLFSPDDYCLVWSDEFNVNGAPNTANWRYEEGCSIRNGEAQYYTNNRRENARVENGLLILEARKESMGTCNYTSASLVSWGKVVYKYGRFEMRAKIDTRQGSWPAFWTLGEAGEWPSNGEIDIMEFYNKMIHANVAWGTETRWSANWDSQTKLVSELGSNWANDFHVWRMEWTPQFIYLYVDNILMNSTDLSKTINGSISNIKNPFQQGQYILVNQAIGGVNGGDPSNTAFPIQYQIDYVRVYQLGNCNLDCNWQQGGTAYTDKCLNCVGGTTGKNACILNCTNLISNPGFETGGLANWTGWGTRSASTVAFSGNTGALIADGSIERTVTVQPNMKYILKAKGKKTGTGWYRLGAKDAGSGELYTQQSNTSWGNISLNFTTGNSTTALIYFYNGGGGTANADDFELQPAGCSVITSLPEEQIVSGLLLFPNPSSNNFNLKVPQEGIMKVYNISGTLLEEAKIQNSLFFGENLKPGTYFIRFESDDISKVISWVKF